MTEVCYGCARDIRIRQRDGRIIWHRGTKPRSRGRGRRWCHASATTSSKWKPPAQPKPKVKMASVSKTALRIRKAALKEVVRARRKK